MAGAVHGTQPNQTWRRPRRPRPHQPTHPRTAHSRHRQSTAGRRCSFPGRWHWIRSTSQRGSRPDTRCPTCSANLAERRNPLAPTLDRLGTQVVSAPVALDQGPRRRCLRPRCTDWTCYRRMARRMPRTAKPLRAWGRIARLSYALPCHRHAASDFSPRLREPLGSSRRRARTARSPASTGALACALPRRLGPQVVQQQA